MSDNIMSSSTSNELLHKKKHFFGVNIGSASILLIFVTLCLVSFATLAIASANADRKLTNKVLERTSAYYSACNRAEHAVAYLDATLQEAYCNTSDKQEYFEAVGHDKFYTFEVNDSQILEVNIEILYPKKDEDTFYRIAGWQVVSNAEDGEGEGIMVIED